MDEIKMPRMRTIKETARETGLAEHYIRQLCITGSIVSAKAGRKYLVNLDRFIEYLNTCRAGPVTEEYGKIRRLEAR